MLDLVKAFNVIDRAFRKKLMLQIGFDPQVLDAWLAALTQMHRTVFFQGAVHQSVASTTGVPEGDPLSVIAMFRLCHVSTGVVTTSSPALRPITYADNWEVISDPMPDVRALIEGADDLAPSKEY